MKSRNILSFIVSLLSVVTLGCAATNTSNEGVDTDNSSITDGAGQRSPQQAVDSAMQKLGRKIASEEKVGQVDWASVVRELEALSDKYGTVAEERYNLGVAKERLGDYSGAEKAYRSALAINPNLSAARENLAGVVLRTGDRRQAISILRELVEIDPEAATARLALGRSLLASGRVDEAIKLSQAALAVDPKNLDGYCILALAAAESNEGPRVRLLRAQAFKLDKGPKRACLHFATGLVLLKEKDKASALFEFSEAVRLDPQSHLEAWFRIAEISMEYKNFARAVESYETVCRMNPSNVEARINLGVALKGMGKFEEAKRAYQKALSLSSGSIPEVHFNLGVLYLKNLDNLAAAEASLRKYIDLAKPPQNAEVFSWIQEIEQRKALESDSTSRR